MILDVSPLLTLPRVLQTRWGHFFQALATLPNAYADSKRLGLLSAVARTH